MAELLKEFLFLLLDDENETLTKLNTIEQAFEVATRRMRFKFDNDPKLQANEYVVEEVPKLEAFHKEFKAQVAIRLEAYREIYSQNLETDRLTRSTFEKFFKSEDRQISDLSRAIEMCYTNLFQKNMLNKHG